MKFTFGIITDGNSDTNLHLIIDSIENQNIPHTDYQVIVVGGKQLNRLNTFVVPFDESIRCRWITRKKNIITTSAWYENIVYLHDYITFEKDWYQKFIKFGNDFDICMNRIINPDGSRFRDWSIWPHNNNEMDNIVLPNRECLIPYDITNLSKYMYISGSYWVAKKQVMLEYPLNENIMWGQGEDVDWSFKVREKYKFSINSHSVVKLLKYKDPAFNIASQETILKLQSIK